MCELLITKGANVNDLDDVSDCVMVSRGERRREGRGVGTLDGLLCYVWILCLCNVFFFVCVSSCCAAESE